MRIFLAGVSCVGKTAIGSDLANLLNYRFFDFDEEVERYYGKPIEHLQEQFVTMDLFRQKASIALTQLLSSKESTNAVIALPPSGLIGVYWETVNKSSGIIIALKDSASNILDRIKFYDKDSKPISRTLSTKEKKYYLADIKKDILYYNNSYRQANYEISIEGLTIQDAARKIKEVVLNEAANTSC